MAVADGAAAGVLVRLPSAVEESLGLDRAERRLIQEGLVAAGFDVGVTDGLFGSGTRAALRSWQSASGASATGYLDADSAAALRSAARAAGQRQAEAEEARRRAEGEAAQQLVESVAARMAARRVASTERVVESVAARMAARRAGAARRLVLGRRSRGAIGGDDSGTAIWTFEGVAGQAVVVEASSDDFDTTLRLVSPSGDQVAYDDDGGDGLNSSGLNRSGAVQYSALLVASLSWGSAR